MKLCNKLYEKEKLCVDEKRKTCLGETLMLCIVVLLLTSSYFFIPTINIPETAATIRKTIFFAGALILIGGIASRVIAIIMGKRRLKLISKSMNSCNLQVVEENGEYHILIPGIGVV